MARKAYQSFAAEPEWLTKMTVKDAEEMIMPFKNFLFCQRANDEIKTLITKIRDTNIWRIRRCQPYVMDKATETDANFLMRALMTLHEEAACRLLPEMPGKLTPRST